jgi:hypothetical protein
VLVINPESGVDHIHPIELRDAKFRPVPKTDGAMQRRSCRVNAIGNEHAVVLLQNGAVSGAASKCCLSHRSGDSERELSARRWAERLFAHQLTEYFLAVASVQLDSLRRGVLISEMPCSPDHCTGQDRISRTQCISARALVNLVEGRAQNAETRIVIA